MTPIRTAKYGLLRAACLALALSAVAQSASAAVIFDYTGSPMGDDHPRAFGPTFALDDFVTGQIIVNDDDVGTFGLVVPLFVSLTINNADGPIFTIDSNDGATDLPHRQAAAIDFMGNSVPAEWRLMASANVIGGDFWDSIYATFLPREFGLNEDGARIDAGVTERNHNHTPGTWTIRQVASVPEPTSIALLGLGLAALGFRRKRR